MHGPVGGRTDSFLLVYPKSAPRWLSTLGTTALRLGVDCHLEADIMFKSRNELQFLSKLGGGFNQVVADDVVCVYSVDFNCCNGEETAGHTAVSAAVATYGG